MSSDYRNTAYNRGIRNNNPGNLRLSSSTWLGKVSSGTDKEFEQFINMKYGIRAMMRNIITHYGRGQNTIKKLITTWAPHFENDTNAYITTVAKSLGININTVLSLNESQMIALSKAITRVEVGINDAQLVKDSDYKSAFAALNDKSVKGDYAAIAKKIIVPVLLFFYSFGAFSDTLNNKILTLKTKNHVAESKRFLHKQ